MNFPFNFPLNSARLNFRINGGTVCIVGSVTLRNNVLPRVYPGWSAPACTHFLGDSKVHTIDIDSHKQSELLVHSCSNLLQSCEWTPPAVT